MKRRAVVVAFLVLGGNGNVRAEDVDAIVKHGIELRRKGLDAEALAEFQRALSIERVPRVQAQAALAEQALGLWEPAEADLLDAVAHGDDPWIHLNRPTLDKALAVIQSHLGTLEIWGSPAGAEITVNAKRVGVIPLAKPVRVAGESVLLTVRAEGYLPVSRSIRVPTRETVREHVELIASPDRVRAPAREAVVGGAANESLNAETRGLERLGVSPPPAADGGPVMVAPAPASTTSVTRPLAWTAGALAAGALVGAAIETVVAFRKYQTFQDHLGGDPTNPGGPAVHDCTTSDLTTECRPLRDAYHQSVTFAAIGYAAAAVFGISSFVLFRLSAPTEGRESAMACVPIAPGPGVECILRF